MVSQKALKQSREFLHTSYEMYVLDVELFLCKLHREHVIPYCQRHGLSFVAGNGTWCFWKGDADSIGQDDEDKLPAGLYALLTSAIPGFPGNDVGSYMPDFKNPNEKA